MDQSTVQLFARVSRELSTRIIVDLNDGHTLVGEITGIVDDTFILMRRDWLSETHLIELFQIARIRAI
jgi:hypothetical protein